MSESKGRKAAEVKKKAARKSRTASKQQRLTTTRAWVVPTFITLMLLGVAWLVTWYLTASTSITVPLMSDLGNWNLLIGMALMGSSFGVATQWK